MLGMYIESLGRCGVAALQRPSFFSAHGKADRIQYKIDGLLRSCLMGHNAVVVQITDHRQIKNTLLGMSVRNVRYPLIIWPVGLELSIEQILVTIICCPILTHLLRRRISAQFWDCAVCLSLPMRAASFGIRKFRDFYSAADGSLPPSQRPFPVCPTDEQNRSIHSEKLTHHGYGIFLPVPVDNSVFCPWPHFLSVDCRKSRSNSFSIRNRLFSYLYSDSVFAGLRPRCFGTPWICFLLSRAKSLFTTALSLNP